MLNRAALTLAKLTAITAAETMPAILFFKSRLAIKNNKITAPIPASAEGKRAAIKESPNILKNKYWVKKNNGG